MKQLFLILSIFTLLSGYSLAQTVCYYELTNGKGDGHFITITSKSCYDSDGNGISLRNGVRFFKGEENNLLLFFGNSIYGDASYYFSKDYSSLKIITPRGEKYFYTRKTAPKGAISAHGTIPQQPSGDANPIVTTYPTATTTTTSGGNTSTSTTPTTPRPCSGCGGSGMCTMCNGKGWYKNMYSGYIYSCSSCGGSGRCRVCHGKGHL